MLFSGDFSEPDLVTVAKMAKEPRRPMLTHFPQGRPEIPVSNVKKAAEYYVNVLGFSFDFGMTRAGLGAVPRGLAVSS
jgi:hypothetical protein